MLAKQRSTVFLIHWRTPATPAEVLDALDPHHRLVILEGDEPTPHVIEVELPGEVELSGQLRRLEDRAFVLVLGPASDTEMLDDLVETYLQWSRPRVASDGIQRWRRLAKAEVARARVVR